MLSNVLYINQRSYTRQQQLFLIYIFSNVLYFGRTLIHLRLYFLAFVVASALLFDVPH